MKTFRVRLNIWKLSGTSEDDVKHTVCELLRKDPERYVSVEPDVPKQSPLKTLIYG